MLISRSFAAVLLSTTLLLSSCFHSHSSDGPPNNLTAEAIQIVTPDPRIAYPLKVLVSITARQAADNVSVSLFAIDRSDDPEVEVRQIPLGTETIERVESGAGSYELNVSIPSSVEFPGPYYIATVVDPIEQIVEFDEEDNTSTTEVDLAAANAPNILLANVALDRAALIINTDEYLGQVGAGNVYNADAGGTITVGAEGLGVGETVDIEAFASLHIIRTDNGTSHDVPLYLWNTAQQRYINAYGIDPDTSIQGEVEWLPMGTFTPQLARIIGEEAELDDVTHHSEHMDFYFPGRLGFELEQALRYPPCIGVCGPPPTGLPTVPPPDLPQSAIDDLRAFLVGLPFSGVRGDESVSLAALDFTVCIKIRSTDPMVSDSIAADNEACPAIDIFLPPLPPGTPSYDIGVYVPQRNTPSESQASGDGFITKNNNKHFAFKIDFGAGATADNRGYIEEVTAGIPVEIFGAGFDFMRITGRAQLVPDYFGKPASEQSGFSYEIRFLNQVIDSLSPTTLSVSIATEPLYSKEVKKEKKFFIGPVPMIAGGSIGGSFGIEYTFGYGDDAPSLFGAGASANPVISLGSSIGPSASLEAGMFAGVGTEVFTVGVEGVVALLEEKIVYFIGTEIEVIDDGFSNVTGDVEFIIAQLQKLSNIFTGPVGSLNLFAKYTVPKVATCKWKFIKVKCIRLGTIKVTKSLYTTPALFRREDILFEDPFAELDVVIVNGKPPAYFVAASE